MGKIADEMAAMVIQKLNELRKEGRRSGIVIYIESEWLHQLIDESINIELDTFGLRQSFGEKFMGYPIYEVVTSEPHKIKVYESK